MKLLKAKLPCGATVEQKSSGFLISLDITNGRGFVQVSNDLNKLGTAKTYNHARLFFFSRNLLRLRRFINALIKQTKSVKRGRK